MKILILLFLLFYHFPVANTNTGTLIIRVIPTSATASFPKLKGDINVTLDGWVITNVIPGKYSGVFHSNNKQMDAELEVYPSAKTTVIVDIGKQVLAKYTGDRNNIEVSNYKIDKPKNNLAVYRREPVRFPAEDINVVIHDSKKETPDFGNVKTIVKVGQERNKNHSIFGKRLKSKGGYYSIEKPWKVNHNNFVSGYATYTDQNYCNPFGSSLTVNKGDLQTYTLGVKYSLGWKRESFKNLLKRGSLYVRTGWEKAIADYDITMVNRVSGKYKDSGLQYGIGFEKQFDHFGLFLEVVEHRADVIDDTSVNFGIFSVL